MSYQNGAQDESADAWKVAKNGTVGSKKAVRWRSLIWLDQISPHFPGKADE